MALVNETVIGFPVAESNASARGAAMPAAFNRCQATLNTLTTPTKAWA